MTRYKYRSKVGIALLLFIVIVMLAATTLMIVQRAWGGLVVITLAVLFIGNMYANTYYRITDDGRLVIRCGSFYKIEVNINDIKRIRKSHLLLSSPALSTDRLELCCRRERIVVSPQDKHRFVSDLLALNPNIETQFEKGQ
jgi:hypothetical protein